MLEVEAIQAGYGPVAVLRGVSFSARAGEIHCLMGRNGAGKTTTLKAVMGLARVTGGRVTLDGRALTGLPPHAIPREGIGYVPQGRRLFGPMTVSDNLEVGLYARRSPAAARQAALDLFPRLAERLTQRADTLSGGEQQMLAVARALCLEPAVLMLDEPTEGLQPSMIAAIREAMVRLRAKGAAVVLVEQRIDAAVALADHVTVIENGQSVETFGSAALLKAPEALHARLGI
jgi:branched-chain amino acid transport system ATP-binding protein